MGQPKPSTATSFPLLASPPGLPLATATEPAPLSTEPMATVSARGVPMLPTDMASDTELPFPPLLRTVTTCTDMSWPLATPSASLILVLLALSSRGLSSTPATARGPLSLSTEEWLSTLDTPCLPLTGLLRVSALDTATATATAMGSTGTARGLLMPTTELLPLPTLSTRPTLATLDLTSRCLAFTPGSATATEATFTKD